MWWLRKMTCTDRTCHCTHLAKLFAACLFFLLLHATAAPDSPARADIVDEVYKYRTYDEMLKFFEDLKAEHPSLVSSWFAHEIFPEILPAGTSSLSQCNDQEPRYCKILVVRIASLSPLPETTPEVFFSGALHGDERLGPAVTAELAKVLCSRYAAGDEEIRRLVDGRGIWIVPMTNPYGVRWNQRGELVGRTIVDPNRDFPYLQDPQRCMVTQTARAVNELFRRHLFTFMLTFHGGMRALTYEWGSFNHMEGHKSSESPDDIAFRSVGLELAKASGEGKYNGLFYPVSRISDLVYPVNGGMEDWSYGAGFEASPKPITICQPKTYGGYASNRTVYRPGSVSTLVYLAEMDDLKSPPEDTLGSSSFLRLANPSGHVARNLLMCLKMIEFARPELVVRPKTWPDTVSTGSAIELEVRGFGCNTVRARLLLLSASPQAGRTCPQEPLAGAKTSLEREAILANATEVATLDLVNCDGLALSRPPSWRGIQGVIPTSLSSGDFCPVLAAEFDPEWKKQDRPDPHVSPRSHAARMRIDDHYTAAASDGPMRLDEFRTKLFRASASVVSVSKVEGPPSDAPQLRGAGQSLPSPGPSQLAAAEQKISNLESQQGEPRGAGSPPTAQTQASHEPESFKGPNDSGFTSMVWAVILVSLVLMLCGVAKMVRMRENWLAKRFRGGPRQLRPSDPAAVGRGQSGWAAPAE